MKFSFIKEHLYLWVLSVGALIMGAAGNVYALQNEAADAVSITLEQAIKHTLTHNPQLHEFDFKQQIVAGEAKTAALTPGYSLGVELENVMGSGDVSGINDAELTLTLSSVIELGDKVNARKGITDAQRQHVLVQRKVRTLDILSEVMRRYIDVLAQQQSLQILKDAEQLARYTYQAVSKRVDAGASPQLEIKRAEAALAQARLSVLTGRQSLQANIKTLAIMWGDKIPAFSQVRGDLFALRESPPFNELMLALSASPNIQAYAEQTRVQDAQLRLTQTDNKPDISWTAGVRRINGIDDTAFVAGASVSLFSQQRNLGQYEAQKARLDQIEQQKQANLRSLYHQVNQALDARNRALLEVKTFQTDIIPPLQAAMAMVEQAYAAGRFSYLEWVSTRQEMLEAQQALIQSAKNAHQRGADLEALTGLPIIIRSQAAAADPLFIEK
jgi:cobalt-zinc-cadmium efflux system outer membrane protein